MAEKARTRKICPLAAGDEDGDGLWRSDGIGRSSGLGVELDSSWAERSDGLW